MNLLHSSVVLLRRAKRDDELSVLSEEKTTEVGESANHAWWIFLCCVHHQLPAPCVLTQEANFNALPKRK